MLFQALLVQASMELGISTERDARVIAHRFEYEGLSFLTITLPKLSDCLENGLEVGRLTCPSGFRRRGSLPALLQGFFRRVFDLGGTLLDEPCADSIAWIRQIARFFKKPKLSCSPNREAKAVTKFKQVEEDLYHATKAVNRPDEILDLVSTILWTAVFNRYSPDDVVCGHGPGVTADRVLGNTRHVIRQWYDRHEEHFPLANHAFANFASAWQGGGAGGVQGVRTIGIRAEPGVRVVFVPKTLTSPRVIAIEPSSMQFVQQGLSRWMVDTLESHWLTAGKVNFTDQTINQKLAFSSSKDRSLATVDLSDASDRVHLELVQRIFRRTRLSEPLEDARSLHADLPDGSNLVLKKYASMGSALCFPVEACVFYTLILSALCSATGTKPSYRSLARLSERVRVYGDDLIVPVEHVDTICDYLESYALRVNRSKTFSNSAFRESCGADFYNGTPVNPVYARMDCPADRREWSPSHLMSWVATANLFYGRGQWIVAQAIRDMVDSIVPYTIPVSTVDSAGLAYDSVFQNTGVRYSKRLQQWRQRRMVFTPIKMKDDIHGNEQGLLNMYLTRGARSKSSPNGTEPTDVAAGNDVLAGFRSQWTHIRRYGPLLPRATSQVLARDGGLSGARNGLLRSNSWSVYCRPRVYPSSGNFTDQRHDSRGRIDTSDWSQHLRDLPVGLDHTSVVKRHAFKPKRGWAVIL